jgi:hypothetical protein
MLLMRWAHYLRIFCCSAPAVGDPRYIRNKRGMMPYHVALAKGHHHLAELLHPDIPYTFIFNNDDMQVCKHLHQQ